MSKRRFVPFAVPVLFAIAGSGAEAAEITRSPNEEMRCYLSVTGPIEQGDAGRIRQAMAAFRTDHPEEARLEYPATMNSWRKVCFDSPGGSFSEGVKIAQLLLSESIGSAVPRDAQCVSACAVAFMGGSGVTNTDGGSIIWRQLHPLGRLGFHTPYLEVPDRDYSAQVVQQAFEGALANIGQLLDRGEAMNFPRSLVLRMLNTSRQEMHLVETVGEASRWGIAIAPVPPREALEPASVINACYNQEAFALDAPQVIFAEGEDVVLQRDGGAWRGSLGAGFRGELASGCEVFQPEPSDYARYGPLTHRATQFITEREGIYPYQMYDPLTPITALLSADGAPPARIPSFEVRASAEAACLVLEGDRVTDSEPCGFEVVKTRHADMSVETLWQFQWPSGSRTILARGDAQSGTPDQLNGVASRRVETWSMSDAVLAALDEGAEGLTPPEDGWLNKSCWQSGATGRLFCMASYAEMHDLTFRGAVE